MEAVKLTDTDIEHCEKSIFLALLCSISNGRNKINCFSIKVSFPSLGISIETLAAKTESRHYG